MKSAGTRLLEQSKACESDQQIHDEVEAYLLQNPALKSYREKVNVVNGHVVLKGLVGSEFRKELSQAVAEGVPGVRGVENELRVDRLAQRRDRDIQADVQSRLRWDPALLNPQIQVQVHHGTVTLAGAVKNQQAKQRAEADAQIAGVTQVNASELEALNGNPSSTLPLH